MTKKELRKKYLELRSALPEALRVAYDAQICETLIGQLQNLENVGIFLPIAKFNEIDLRPLLENINFSWSVPISNLETGEMAFSKIDQFTLLKENSWGILEPKTPVWINANELDALIVPLLISDKKGYRVGYGKGFYDLFITKCRPDCLKIGVNYSEPIEEIFDIDNFDKALNICVTPKNVTLCNFIEKKTKK